MPSDLTLPGDIPGLLRRGSPVVVKHDGRHMVLLYVDADGIAPCARAWRRDPPPDEARLWDSHGWIQPSSGLTTADIALDLTDATGRAHAGWWLAGMTDAHFRWQPVGQSGSTQRWDDNGEPYSAPSPPEPRWCAHKHRPGHWKPYFDEPSGVAPYLSDLDPDDPRTLPDGSRWVDAEALRRVVLHVCERRSDG